MTDVSQQPKVSAISRVGAVVMIVISGLAAVTLTYLFVLSVETNWKIAAFSVGLTLVALWNIYASFEIAFGSKGSGWRGIFVRSAAAIVSLMLLEAFWD